MADEKKEKEITAGENLRRYEWAELAGTVLQDKSRHYAALEAMSRFYRQFGVDADDPVIAKAITEAAAGMGNGQLTSAALFNAVALYTKKFDAALNATKVSEFVDYSGYKVPDDVKPLLEKYKDKTIAELKEKAEGDKDEDIKPDEEAIKVLNAVGLLKDYRLESGLYVKLVEERTKSGLENLVKKEE